MAVNLAGALSKMLNSVVSSDNLDALLEKAARELCAIEGYDRVSIALFDLEQNAFIERIVCESASGDVPDCRVGGEHVPYSEENLLGQAVIHSLPYAYVTNEDPPSSEVVIPLSSRDNLVGAVSVVSNRKDHFEQADLDKLTDYGRVLSVAIENRILSSCGQDFRNKDTLTGLFSQRYLQARISHEIERVDRFGGVFSLGIVEVDNYTDFRKKHGHHLAGEALKEISRQLSENLREVDVAARYGEKEFAVVLPHADQEHALRAARRIQELVEEISFTSEEGKEAKLSVSLGIAVYPDDSPFKDGLLEAADMALAKGRERGSNQIFTYQELAREQGILSNE